MSYLLNLIRIRWPGSLRTSSGWCLYHQPISYLLSVSEVTFHPGMFEGNGNLHLDHHQGNPYTVLQRIESYNYSAMKSFWTGVHFDDRSSLKTFLRRCILPKTNWPVLGNILTRLVSLSDVKGIIEDYKESHWLSKVRGYKSPPSLDGKQNHGQVTVLRERSHGRGYH